ncbi:ABC transporter permease [Streptomyces sp. ODS28]|uniref:ABC transporter permease n=1 Tax=Streptomyces sp. ODS28 TaxID=3136688 RepID=UPI0031E98216
MYAALRSTVPAALRAALAIALKDLRQRVRDRSAFILFLLAPVLVSGLMAMAFSRTDLHADVGVVNLDHGPAATGLVRVLNGRELRNLVDVRPYADRTEAARAVEGEKVDAAVVIPAGFTSALGGRGSPPPLTVLDHVDQPLAAQIVRAVSQSYVAQVNADRLSVRTALAAGAPADRTARLAAATGRLAVPERVRALGLSDHRLETISYFAPGMGMFFVLFMVGFGARGYFTEQRQGTLDRIAAAPVGHRTVLLGKSLSTFAYSLACLSAVLAISWLAFGAHFSDLWAVGALCVAMAVAVVCLTALVITLARTERQADAIGSLLTFVLALMGGNFIFAAAGPPLLRKLALFTPNGWALRGFTDLGTGVRGLAAVGAPLMGIGIFCLGVTAVTLAVSGLRRAP